MREALRRLPVFVVKGGDMLKIYIINGKEWQYEEGEQPKGAVEKKPEDKSKKTPANKARRAPKDK